MRLCVCGNVVVPADGRCCCVDAQTNERIIAVLVTFAFVIAYAVIGCARKPLLEGSEAADMIGSSTEIALPRFQLGTNFCSPNPEEAPPALSLGRWLVVLALAQSAVWTEVVVQLLKIYIRRY